MSSKKEKRRNVAHGALQEQTEMLSKFFPVYIAISATVAQTGASVSRSSRISMFSAFDLLNSRPTQQTRAAQETKYIADPRSSLRAALASECNDGHCWSTTVDKLALWPPKMEV
jgi:hypothetical protein